jgi:hypothetical protein
MKFPARESDIIALANLMYAGYSSHIADFPSINRNALFVTRSLYKTALKAKIDAIAVAQLATEAKNDSLNALKEEMINCLKKSEVDAADNPDKLTEIGWGPKAIPRPAEPPGGPKNLIIAEQGKNTLRLHWDRPETTDPVRNYIIERRRPDGAAAVTAWVIIGTAIGDGITLTRQPRGIRLEYRVSAANNAGTGPFSNTVSVVL